MVLKRESGEMKPSFTKEMFDMDNLKKQIGFEEIKY